MKNQKGISIFVVDDDKVLAKALKNEMENHFRKFNVSINTFDAGEQCKSALSQKPDIAIVDYHLDSKFRDAMNGVKTIDMIKRESPDTEVIMFTGEENADIAVKAMHHGAHDYIVKNDNMFRKLNMAIYQCIRLKELRKEVKKQKVMTMVAVITVSLLIGVAVAIQVFAPQVL